MAKKALEQSRRLGSARIAEAINLIAAADLDIRGKSGMSAETVVEILVARLARQTRPRHSTDPAPTPGAEAVHAAPRRTATPGRLPAHVRRPGAVQGRSAAPHPE